MRGRKKRWKTGPGGRRADSLAGAELGADFYPQVRSWFLARVANEQEAQDLAQEVFAQLQSPDASDDPKTHLAAVASKTLARYRRQEARERAVLRKLLAEVLRDNDARQMNGLREAPDAENSVAECREFVEEILNGRKPADRELLKLRFVEGLRTAEIARRIGCSTGAVSKRIQRIVRRIRSEYGMDPRPTKKP